MTQEELIRRFSDTPARQGRAIFSMLFILTNKLQTLFDSRIPDVTLKQFMLLSLLHQADEPQTLTQLGDLLGCSRQNVKKLAQGLQGRGFVTVRPNPGDSRAVLLETTGKADRFFSEDFRMYQEQLGSLFSVYTPEELAKLYELLSRMFAGIDCLAVQADSGKQAPASKTGFGCHKTGLG
ncbi:MarR family transcriptional regulator [uncultured Faecalibaculum sp.]|uniref:MarR family winged helix-turn-helix transcriptional regulator n=1 Tax=uncultured Faecalibaculum sp. TaxID=1729681 RepID=UPI00260ED764|nr:MarR family transcriptional regulator [uncultured Faecalibaculum sp.]